MYGNELYLSDEPQSQPESQNTLDKYNQSICDCMECPLGKTRTKFVFGAGDLHADLLIVGEAPGEFEDLKGDPLVGSAGKMLNKILLAINLKREKGAYIANVIKCRPPNNRDPLPSEVAKCEPYLMEQINLIQPKLIVALGRFAGKSLLKMDVPLKEMREKTHNYMGTPLRVTYHPAALVRNPTFKKPCWEDFQWIENYLKTN